MPIRHLRLFRVVVAAGMLAALTAPLVDFRGLVPVRIGHWLASTQFVPSLVGLVTGASLSLACIVVLVITLAVGRVYCAAVCPLGILQDVIARLAGWIRGRKSRLLPPAPPRTWLRQLFLWGTGVGIVAGWSGLTLSLLDPYSHFGRIAVDILRPLVAAANDAVVAPANAIGLTGFYRVTPQWAGAGALALPVFMVLLLAVLAGRRGRLYCNTICPVGTLLGMLARRAAWRLTIDRNVCTQCGDCLRVCKAQCIDLRARAIDFSRCVACCNCLDACRQQGVGYRRTWGTNTSPDPAAVPTGPASAFAPDLPRRLFLTETAGTIAFVLAVPPLLRQARNTPADPGVEGSPGQPTPETSRAICPPGAFSVDRFLDRCTACHLCLSACPTHVLQPAFLEYGFAGWMKPRLDFTKSACTYTCRACGEACPDGAITLLALADKQLTRIGEARLDVDRCIVKTKGTDCAACSEQCPTQAVTTVPFGNNLRLPQFNRDLCIGCGGCEFACPVQPVKAIIVIGQRRHGRAKRAAEQKAVAPVPAGDFPF